jgi:hypothetical protein
VGQWAVAGALEAAPQARLEIKQGDAWTTVASGAPADLPRAALQPGHQYRLALLGRGAVVVQDLRPSAWSSTSPRNPSGLGRAAHRHGIRVEIPAGAFMMGSPD